VSSKNHYDVLEVVPTAPADEIKRAFRAQIARYHPDKVQHLGREFQEMAAGRAAELTEAYRVLSSESQRADYDRSLAAAPHSAPPSPAAAAAAANPSAAPSPAPPPQAEPRARGFTSERTGRDQFVRRATFDKIRQALALAGTVYEETAVAGFDIGLVAKAKLFGPKRPRLLGRFIEPVDGAAVAAAWSQAAKWAASANDEVCVLLLGSTVAPARELAEAIAVQRRRNPDAKLTIIPIDVRTWDAHIPLDAPGVCKDLLTRLKSGN
jgi:curved DNA-binding protein CbpA